ncbi:hypothetical protein Q1695_015987 [Nippostrongylus brasiliensis]|nr:hypothetical protein Q1695_015987 [Nippostrongylus brasiliensis]
MLSPTCIYSQREIGGRRASSMRLFRFTMSRTLLLYLLVIIISSVRAQFLRDHTGFTYLPANVLMENNSIQSITFHRQYSITPCFPCILQILVPTFWCGHNHTVIMAFFKNWFALERDIANGTPDHAILFSGRKRSSHDTLYSVATANTSHIEFASTNVLANLEIYAYIEPDMVRVFAANLALNLTFDRRIMPEHFALFASGGCPAAIVDVSGTFPDWLPIYRIPVQGKVVEKPPDPTTFRDVIIAVIIVIVYYLVLTNFILPLHFQLWMPLENRQGE